MPVNRVDLGAKHDQSVTEKIIFGEVTEGMVFFGSVLYSNLEVE